MESKKICYKKLIDITKLTSADSTVKVDTKFILKRENYYNTRNKYFQEIGWNVLFTSPNVDKEAEILLIKLKEFLLKDPNKYFHIPSLGQTK